MLAALKSYNHDVFLDQTVLAADRKEVVRLCRAAGNFTAAEVDVAGELVETRLETGSASGYFFIMARKAEKLLGYVCYGPIPCTRCAWDIYWIVVDPVCHQKGLGRLLLAEAEGQIGESGGQRVYVETSSTEKYRAARGFYTGRGYRVEAVLKDFYASNDDKFIFLKILDHGDHRDGPCL